MRNSQNGKRIVDLCIYVDENAYKENHDKEKIFDALYKIVYALSMKQKIFHNWNDYEEFSLEYASKLYYRLINAKQFLPEGHPFKLKKIKSILNYVKKTLSPARVDYQQRTFAEQFDPVLHEAAVLDLREQCIAECKAQTQFQLKIEFESYLQRMTETIKWFIRNCTPYGDDKCMRHKLYQSCLLTFLNQITLSNQNKQRFKNRLKNGYNIDHFIDQVYEDEKMDSVIIFHLPSNMENYVATCVNRIKKLMLRELSGLIGSFEPSDLVIQAVISSAMGDSRDQE